MTATATHSKRPRFRREVEVFNELFDTSPIGFAAGDANLTRYVGNSPTNATDPTGLIQKSQAEIDEEKFRRSAANSGVPRELVEMILQIARDTPIGSGQSGVPIGSHQICADWVFAFEKRLDEALRKKYGDLRTRGISSRNYLILDVPLGAQGNERSDISYRNWFLPRLFDLLNSGGPARHGSTNGIINNYPPCDPEHYRKRMLGQIHTVYKLTLADGSVWYVDLGALQRVLATDSSIDDLGAGRWVITPSTRLPGGWVPTTRTTQPSGTPRED